MSFFPSEEKMCQTEKLDVYHIQITT